LTKEIIVVVRPRAYDMWSESSYEDQKSVEDTVNILRGMLDCMNCLVELEYWMVH
jgi:hypothetical protein